MRLISEQYYNYIKCALTLFSVANPVNKIFMKKIFNFLYMSEFPLAENVCILQKKLFVFYSSLTECVPRFPAVLPAMLPL